MNNNLNQLLEQGKYIDQGISYLMDLLDKKKPLMTNSNENFDIIQNIEIEINNNKNQLKIINEKVNNLSNFSLKIKETQKKIEEIKKFGLFLGLPFSQDFNKLLLTPTKKSEKLIKSNNNSPILIKNFPSFVEITNLEYDSLTHLIRLLVKFEDLNKHYKTLFDSLQNNFTMEDVSSLIPVAGSRLDALIKALISLKRINLIEENSIKVYKFM